MKLNEMRIFLFIACVIIGLLISLNLNLGNINAAVMVDSQQYKKLIDSKLQIQKDISNLKQQRYENNQKLNLYKNSATSTVREEMEHELEYTKLLLGTTEVKGEGIKISIKDHSYDYGNSIEGNDWSDANIIHAEDLMVIVKTLRNVGAKAISINGFRLTVTSSLICSGQFIAVDSIKIPAPYYIHAIGNKDTLYKFLQEDGFTQLLRKQRYINVFVDKVDDITIPAYVGDLSSSYLKDVKK